MLGTPRTGRQGGRNKGDDAMSWDLFAFKKEGAFGTVAQVRAELENRLPVEWGGSFWCYYFGDGFTLEINIGDWRSQDEDPLDNISIEVRGGGDPMPILVELAAANGWVLSDLATGQVIDPDAPPDEGWKIFQSTRDEGMELVRKKYGQQNGDESDE